MGLFYAIVMADGEMLRVDFKEEERQHWNREVFSIKNFMDDPMQHSIFLENETSAVIIPKSSIIRVWLSEIPNQVDPVDNGEYDRPAVVNPTRHALPNDLF